VVEHVNTRYRASHPDNDVDIAICISQDGWHLPRSALDKFHDVKNAHDRRGAAFTFDGVAFSDFVIALRHNSRTAVIVDPSADANVLDRTAEELSADGNLTTGGGVLYAPGFSHTLKDPTANALAIFPHHQLIIIEGLYTFLGIKPWNAASAILDERWFIDVDPTEARDRLIRRHVITGVAADLTEAKWRADNNDIPNGEFIRQNMLQPTRVIRSVNDPVIASHNRTE